MDPEENSVSSQNKKNFQEKNLVIHLLFRIILRKLKKRNRSNSNRECSNKKNKYKSDRD